MTRALSALTLALCAGTAAAGHCYGFSGCTACLTAGYGAACEFYQGSCQMETDADDGSALTACRASECPDAPGGAGGAAASSLPGDGFFVDRSELLSHNPVQRNYGISVSDVDRDGKFDAFVAGNGFNNLLLSWDADAGHFVDVATPALQNPSGRAIGVAACDMNGDGWEEMYVLNAQSYSGKTATTADLLFNRIGEPYRHSATEYARGICHADAGVEDAPTAVEGSSGYFDMFAQPENADAASFVAGRSCACVDRTGNGKYAVLVSNYASTNDPDQAVKLIEEVGGELRDVAQEAGVAKSAGGRAVISAPILAGSVGPDIFCNNEIDYSGGGGRERDLSEESEEHHLRGHEEAELSAEEERAMLAEEAEGGAPKAGSRRRLSHRSNYFFRNNEDGTFTDVAAQLGDLRDPNNTGRGTSLLDANGDGLFDIVYGNWQSEHKLLIQSATGAAGSTFTDSATAEMKVPGPVRTTIVADWDNDGYEEIFFNFIPGDNRLFRKTADDADWVQVNIGDAKLPCGHGTGAAVADWDGDGRLELMVSHGESASQPMSFFHPAAGSDNNWLRILPRTQFGAPARGAVVSLLELGGRRQLRAIDGGSGYLCQMEPVAHYGLGQQSAVASVTVTWPDGSSKTIEAPAINTLHTIDHPSVKSRCDTYGTCPSGYHAKQSPGDIECTGAAGSECDADADRDTCCDPEAAVLDNVQDLWNQYGNIFRRGNRNAASHLWSSFILERSEHYSAAKFEELFSGFCGVSGSPVSASDAKRYRMTLPTAAGQTELDAAQAGLMYFCCSPCVCDTMDFIKIDTKTVQLADGVTKQYRFGVVGNVCHHSDMLEEEYTTFGRTSSLSIDARELHCEGCELSGATLSDNGHVIISMFFDDDPALTANNHEDYAGFCAQRASGGYNSGMGFIFRKMAELAYNTEQPTCCAGDAPAVADVDCEESVADASTCTEVGQDLHSVTTPQSGNGAPCTGEAVLCEAGQGSIPHDIDCEESVADVSTCTEAGQDLHSVTTPQSGNGAPCTGEAVLCEAGQGSIPHDIDCEESVADVSTCTEVGQDLHSVTTPQSGNGAPCTGEAVLCEAGQGSIPPNVDCTGDWSTCTAQCDRTWEEVNAQSGAGAACPELSAAPACAAGVDACPEAPVNCAGEWSACTAACERDWVEETAPNAFGAACPDASAAPACAADEDDCPPPAVDCEGSWSMCSEACETADQRFWTERVPPSGDGLACPDAADCLIGDGRCFPMEDIESAALLLAQRSASISQALASAEATAEGAEREAQQAVAAVSALEADLARAEAAVAEEAPTVQQELTVQGLTVAHFDHPQVRHAVCAGYAERAGVAAADVFILGVQAAMRRLRHRRARRRSLEDAGAEEDGAAAGVTCELAVRVLDQGVAEQLAERLQAAPQAELTAVVKQQLQAAAEAEPALAQLAEAVQVQQATAPVAQDAAASAVAFRRLQSEQQEAAAAARVAQQEAAERLELARRQAEAARKEATEAKCAAGIVWSETGTAPCRVCTTCPGQREPVSPCTADADAVCLGGGAQGQPGGGGLKVTPADDSPASVGAKDDAEVMLSAENTISADVEVMSVGRTASAAALWLPAVGTVLALLLA